MCFSSHTLVDYVVDDDECDGDEVDDDSGDDNDDDTDDGGDDDGSDDDNGDDVDDDDDDDDDDDGVDDGDDDNFDADHLSGTALVRQRRRGCCSATRSHTRSTNPFYPAKIISENSNLSIWPLLDKSCF